ncbi:MAG TPA: thioredoxin family protein [Dermatophilaceae bacterium]|nr:thioredoxin family protein [Dermatophilaceae bacterium]
MQVIVLGRQDRNVQHIEQAARSALAAAGMEAAVTTSADPDVVAAHRPARTPALVVDGRVVLEGCVPSAEEVRDLLGLGSA